MKRVLASVGVCLLLLFLTGFASAKDKKPKPGPLTGTWQCTGHGAPQGDMPFTLTLEQDKDKVSGSVSSPLGSTEIASGSFKKKSVQIRIESPQANYLLTGKLRKNELSGEWSTDTQLKGTWEGKKLTTSTP